MKIKNVPGEFAFKALVKFGSQEGWILSDTYYLTKEETLKEVDGNTLVIWPVEVHEDGSVYVPAPEELE